jgi:hypothetical protein
MTKLKKGLGVALALFGVYAFGPQVIEGTSSPCSALAVDLARRTADLYGLDPLNNEMTVVQREREFGGAVIEAQWRRKVGVVPASLVCPVSYWGYKIDPPRKAHPK